MITYKHAWRGSQVACLLRVWRIWRGLQRLDDVGGILALQAGLDAVVAIGVLLIALDSPSLAIEAATTRLCVALPGDGLARQRTRAVEPRVGQRR